MVLPTMSYELWVVIKRGVGNPLGASYGHHLGGAIGLGYVPCAGETIADILASTYEIDVAGTRGNAEGSLKPMYDPSGARTKA